MEDLDWTFGARIKSFQPIIYILLNSKGDSEQDGKRTSSARTASDIEFKSCIISFFMDPPEVKLPAV